MSTTFSLYRPLTSPQSITHSVYTHLLSPTSCDLVIIRTNEISIYSIPQEAFESPATITATTAARGTTSQPLMHRKYDANMFGNVEGICSVRLAGWSRDAILLTYPHSKLSLLAWDQGTHELVTLSIWSQDDEVVQKELERERAAVASATGQKLAGAKSLPPALLVQVKKYIHPILRVDPSNRCAALTTFDAFLNIFDLTSNSDHAVSSSSSSSSAFACPTGVSTSAATGLASFHSQCVQPFTLTGGVGVIPSFANANTISLSALGLGTVTDMQFLYGFEDPTLLILHERQRTWEGRYAAARTTQHLTCVTFHLKGGFSVIGSVANIPHDAFSVHPISMPLGGAIILSQSTITHWNNNTIDYALTMNEQGMLNARTEKVHAEPSNYPMKLDRARMCFLSVYSDKALAFLVSSDGMAFLLTITPSGQNIRNMNFEPLGIISEPRGVLRVPNPLAVRTMLPSMPSSNQHNVAAAHMSSFVFTYSHTGPAMLIETRRAREEDIREMIFEQSAEQEEEKKEKDLKEKQEEAVKAATKVKEEQAKAMVKQEPETLAPLPSLSSQLDAAAMDTSDSAGTTAPPTATSSSDGSSHPVSADANGDDGEERPAKRSKLDELYREMTGEDMAQDELIDLLGFGRKGESNGAQNGATVTEKKESDVKTEQKASEDSSLMQMTTAREAARRTKFDHGMRMKKDVVFFIRDSLACASPASDLTLTYALPRTQEEDDSMLMDQPSQERDEPKPKTDEEERAADEKERIATIELEKKWRERERKTRVVEFLQLSGHGHTGAVTIWNEGILPDIITASPLQRRCTGCWTLRTGGAKKKKRAQQQQQQLAYEEYHSFLLISTPSTTLVIQTGTELQEVTSDQHRFFTGPTIAAGNISLASNPEDEAIVQVYTTGMRVISQNTIVQTFDIIETTTAVIEALYVLLHNYTFQVEVYQTVLVGEKINLQRVATIQVADTVCIFKDTSAARAVKTSGLSTASQRADVKHSKEEMKSSSTLPPPPASTSNNMSDIDDLERLLGGDDAHLPVAPQPIETKTVVPAEVVPSDYYAVISKQDGTIEFQSLPSCKVVLTLHNLALGPKVLHANQSSLELNIACDMPRIVDLSVQLHGEHPTLFAILSNGDLLAYQGFTVTSSSSSSQQELRWHRLETPITRPFLNTKSLLTFASSSAATKNYRDAFGVNPVPKTPKPSRFQAFNSLNGPSQSPNSKKGVLLTGTKPLLILYERGAYRFHDFLFNTSVRDENVDLEQEEDVEVDDQNAAISSEEVVLSEELEPSAQRKQGLIAATPFHIKNCRYGLIYFDSHGTLHMSALQTPAQQPYHPVYASQRKRAALGLYPIDPVPTPQPTGFNYDGKFVSHSIPLGATPCFIARHITTNTTAVVVSYEVRIASLELENEYTLPQYQTRYELILFSSSWEILSRWKEFEPNEIVLCMSAIRMNKKIYLVLGTSSYESEDHSTRGRIICIDLALGLGNGTTIDPQTGEYEQIKLLKLKVFTQAEKLPVTQVHQLAHNVLITCQGSRIILYRHTGKVLHGCAFFDGQMYITSVASLNYFILYGDIQCGGHLLYYDPILKTLTQLGQTHEKFHVTSCEFMVDLKHMNIMLSDQSGNLSIYKFQPNTPSAQAANRIGSSVAYENPHVAHHPQSTMTLKDSPYTQTSLLGGLGYSLNLKNDFHIGERIGKMLKMKMRIRAGVTSTAVTGAPLSMERQNSSSSANSPAKLSRQLSSSLQVNTVRPIQSYVLMQSYNGTYTQVLPVDPLIFRRLSTLTIQMSVTLHQLGGLNPIGYRLFQASPNNGSADHPHNAKKLLDATLLLAYPLLNIQQQYDLASHIGTTPAQIIEHIKWILWATQLH